MKNFHRKSYRNPGKYHLLEKNACNFSIESYKMNSPKCWTVNIIIFVLKDKKTCLNGSLTWPTIPWINFNFTHRQKWKFYKLNSASSGCCQENKHLKFQSYTL